MYKPYMNILCRGDIMDISKKEAEELENLICRVIAGQLYDEGYTDVLPLSDDEEA